MRTLFLAAIVASTSLALPHAAWATGPCNPEIQDCY